MIPFFRKIRKKLADENKPIGYMRYAIGEILLVVVGILIALQVNNWNENKNTRQIEHKLLRELKDDLEETKVDLLTDMDKARFELLATDSLYQQILKDRSAGNPRPIKISMSFIYNRSDLYPKNSAYESLKAFGINLISNDTLRKSITDLYELQLVRVDALEKFIKEILEKEFTPHLFKESKPTHQCEDCQTLEEVFNSSTELNSIFYQIEAPSDELIHLLKTKYLAYNALTGLYDTTQSKIDGLIEIIDVETSQSN